jgi:hypothetical protein
LLSFDHYFFLSLSLLLSEYCRVSIKSTPLRDRDTSDEILVSSPSLEGRDKCKNLSGVTAF